MKKLSSAILIFCVFSVFNDTSLASQALRHTTFRAENIQDGNAVVTLYPSLCENGETYAFSVLAEFSQSGTGRWHGANWRECEILARYHRGEVENIIVEATTFDGRDSRIYRLPTETRDRVFYKILLESCGLYNSALSNGTLDNILVK